MSLSVDKLILRKDTNILAYRNFPIYLTLYNQ